MKTTDYNDKSFACELSGHRYADSVGRLAGGLEKGVRAVYLPSSQNALKDITLRE